MAKSKKEESNDIVMEAMPGGEPLKEEDTKFEVDLNFDTPEEEPEDEEVTEETDTPATEETVEEESQPEEETETTSEPENSSEEGVDENSEGDAQPDLQPVENSDQVVSEQVEEPKAPMVPKSRLDEVLAKQKALQKQLDDFTKAQEEAKQQVPDYDFTAKEVEYQQLVLDGETDKATELRNEIREAEKAQFMAEVEQKMGSTVQQDKEMTALQAKAAEIETKYPFLSENSADFDAGLQEEVISLRDAFISQGYSPADALDKAATYTVTVQKPQAVASEAPAKPSLDTKQVQEKKNVANINKKLQAADSQPPEMKGEGARGNKKIDLHTLSDDEFGALPEETLRRMRGDFGT